MTRYHVNLEEVIGYVPLVSGVFNENAIFFKNGFNDMISDHNVRFESNGIEYHAKSEKDMESLSPRTLEFSKVIPKSLEVFLIDDSDSDDLASVLKLSGSASPV